MGHSEHTKMMMERIDSGEMKLVEASVMLVVPSNITNDAIIDNVSAGVSYITEEHLFFVDETIEEVEDDVRLLKVECHDVELEKVKQ